MLFTVWHQVDIVNGPIEVLCISLSPNLMYLLINSIDFFIVEYTLQSSHLGFQIKSHTIYIYINIIYYFNRNNNRQMFRFELFHQSFALLIVLVCVAECGRNDLSFVVAGLFVIYFSYNFLVMNGSHRNRWLNETNRQTGRRTRKQTHLITSSLGWIITRGLDVNHLKSIN